MTSKTAFKKGRAAAVQLPAEAAIRPGDRIKTTVLAFGKVLIESHMDLPDYSQVIAKRSRRGGHVTNELVARLLAGR